MNGYVIALDQGTTSSRSIIFDASGNIVTPVSYTHLTLPTTSRV